MQDHGFFVTLCPRRGKFYGITMAGGEGEGEAEEEKGIETINGGFFFFFFGGARSISTAEKDRIMPKGKILNIIK